MVLAPLDIAREGTRIGMKVSPQGLEWQQAHPVQKAPDGGKIVTLNIGCGTADALNKRPVIAALAQCVASLYERQGFTLWLSGAGFERDINEEFAAALQNALSQKNLRCEIIDWAGQCTLSQLTGLLACSDLVISTDSGPYHMAVALNVPTLCWFNFETIPSLHHEENVRNLILPTPAEFTDAALELLQPSGQA